MPSSSELFSALELPLIAAPLFLVSTPELVIACCRAGIVGTFPALNARPLPVLDEWITTIQEQAGATPFGVNLIVHKTNLRLEDDLQACVRHRVPLIITSVGEPSGIVPAIHAYGGLVFHDVISIRHVKKALQAGVDGLILVCAGAGGHGGTLNPFAFLGEVRTFYSGPLLLSGALSTGQHIRAAELMGANFAYMGTRLIATREANASPEYKQMILDSGAADVLYSSAFTGVHGNYLRTSVERAGLDPENIAGAKDRPDLSLADKAGARVWRDIWGAGQGVGAIHDIPTVAELVVRLRREYDAACHAPAMKARGPL